MRKKIVINGKSYRLSPLTCKALRQISELMLDGELSSDDAYETIVNWMPFILESLRVNHPNVTEALVEELSLEEFNTVITSVIKISGIKLTSKREEDTEVATDWDWIYSRLCVNTSLRYKDIDDLTLYQAESVLHYLANNPTTAEILTVVHSIKTNRATIRQSTEAEIQAQFSKLDVDRVEGLPEDMKANLRWAEDLAAKYRKAMSKRSN